MKNIASGNIAIWKKASGLQKEKIYRLLILGILSFLSSVTFAQKALVLEIFDKHGINSSVLNPDNFKQRDDFSFDLKQTVLTSGDTSVTSASFDPSKEGDEAWTVKDVNGNTPSQKEIRSFRKDKRKASVTPQHDDTSYKVEEENSERVVISFKEDVNTLTKDASFLKDCRNYLTINVQTKEIEQLRVVNEKPVKIKILSVDKLTRIVKFERDQKTKVYLIAVDDLDISGRFMGQDITVQTLMEYTSFVRK